MNIRKIGIWIYRTVIKLIIVFASLCCFNFFSVQSDFLLKSSIECQIRYLQEQHENDLGEKAQKRFPEGRLFTNLILALSIIEFSEKSEYSNHHFVESLILDCNTEEAKQNFRTKRTIKYGAFYNGWINYTLKKYIESKLFLQSNRADEILSLRTEFETRILQSQADSICVLETYNYSIWSGDNLACIASLDSQYHDLKVRWVDLFYKYSKSGFMSHEGFGENAQLIRGCSQALIHYFMYEIDSSRFVKSIDQYRSQFVDKFAGIELVKEYAISEGAADVDSGPIIWGYGSVATIMNNKLSLRYQENPSRITLGLLNMIGFPINNSDEKFFLGGYESMYDIFYLWNAVEAY